MSDDGYVRFFVPGTPRPAGSKDTGVAHRRDPSTGQQVPVTNEHGRLVTFTRDSSGAHGKAWRTDVRDAGAKAMADAGLPLFDGPVRVLVVFHMARPKNHYGSGNNSSILKHSAPRWHTSRPDVDKLSRAVLDALKGVCWRDDSQVVYKEALKPYADRHLGQEEGAEVAIQPLPDRHEPTPDEAAQMELTP